MCQLNSQKCKTNDCLKPKSSWYCCIFAQKYQLKRKFKASSDNCLRFILKLIWSETLTKRVGNKIGIVRMCVKYFDI